MADVKIWTTKALCDELAARKNLSTDYQLAKFLGANQTNISGWRKGFRWMNDEWAERLATELGLDPAYVLLCLATERADAKMAGVMRNWLMQHGTAAALAGTVFTVVSALALLSPAAFASAGLCILCSIADTGRWCLRRVLTGRLGPSYPAVPFVGKFLLA